VASYLYTVFEADTHGPVLARGWVHPDSSRDGPSIGETIVVDGVERTVTFWERDAVTETGRIVVKPLPDPGRLLPG